MECQEDRPHEDKEQHGSLSPAARDKLKKIPLRAEKQREKKDHADKRSNRHSMWRDSIA
jgi:hypothetical protein